MGDSFNEGVTAEQPTQTVYISAFYIDQYEVTKALWDDVQTWATNHGYTFGCCCARAAGTNHPVNSINWYDAVTWCNARSEKEGRVPAYYTDAAHMVVYRGGNSTLQNDWVKWNTGYRLPTEAEWEKAARGGVPGRRFAWSDADTITHSRANYYSNTGVPYDVSPTPGYHPMFGYSTSPVGYFPPTGYGLYDMIGNIYEWCWDWSANYAVAAGSDPKGPASGAVRALRGGSWSHGSFFARVASRGGNPPDAGSTLYGFRSVLGGTLP